MKKIIKALTASLFFLTSCEWVDYHPYSGDYEGDSHLTEFNLERIKRLKLGNEYTFAFITDTQRWYDDTRDAVNHINARGDIDFVLHGGDLTDFGAIQEFEWMRDELCRLKMPLLTVIGNHDCQASGENVYNVMFGKSNYALTVGNTRIIAINSSALEHDYLANIPDFNFLQNEINYCSAINEAKADSLTHTIMFMHARPNDDQFNNNALELFNIKLSQLPGFLDDSPKMESADSIINGSRRDAFCLCGHCHSTKILNPFNDGKLFYQCANIEARTYLVFHIKKEGYSYEVVKY